jgi:hypothetical protein
MKLIKGKAMELNGVANMLCLLQLREMSGDHIGSAEEVLIKRLRAELDTLERYMIACNKAIRTDEGFPMWHEVRDNKSGFPKRHDNELNHTDE